MPSHKIILLSLVIVFVQLLTDYGAEFRYIKDYSYHEHAYDPPGLFYDKRKKIFRSFPGGGRPLTVDYKNRCAKNYLGLKAYAEHSPFYYVCKKDCIVNGTCPELQIFDNSANKCVQQSLIKFPTDDIVPVCSHVGRFPVYSNCSLYKICDDQLNSKLVMCPGSASFSPIIGHCSNNYKCMPTVISTAGNFTAAAGSEEKFLPCAKPGKFYSPTDFNLYYTCHSTKNNGAFVQTRYKCPDQTNYDRKKGICLPPREVSSYKNEDKHLAKYQNYPAISTEEQDKEASGGDSSRLTDCILSMCLGKEATKKYERIPRSTTFKVVTRTTRSNPTAIIITEETFKNTSNSSKEIIEVPKQKVSTATSLIKQTSESLLETTTVTGWKLLETTSSPEVTPLVVTQAYKTNSEAVTTQASEAKSETLQLSSVSGFEPELAIVGFRTQIKTRKTTDLPPQHVTATLIDTSFSETPTSPVPILSFKPIHQPTRVFVDGSSSVTTTALPSEIATEVPLQTELHEPTSISLAQTSVSPSVAILEIVKPSELSFLSMYQAMATHVKKWSPHSNEASVPTNQTSLPLSHNFIEVPVTTQSLEATATTKINEMLLSKWSFPSENKTLGFQIHIEQSTQARFGGLSEQSTNTTKTPTLQQGNGTTSLFEETTVSLIKNQLTAFEKAFPPETTPVPSTELPEPTTITSVRHTTKRMQPSVMTILFTSQSTEVSKPTAPTVHKMPTIKLTVYKPVDLRIIFRPQKIS